MNNISISSFSSELWPYPFNSKTSKTKTKTTNKMWMKRRDGSIRMKNEESEKNADLCIIINQSIEIYN